MAGRAEGDCRGIVYNVLIEEKGGRARSIRIGADENLKEEKKGQGC
jgi:hypothetical protein